MGNGWSFARIVAGGEGVLYGIDANGDLLWYRHTGDRIGVLSWLGPEELSSGWSGLSHSFAHMWEPYQPPVER